MGDYRVLAPCTVRQNGGESAVHYRQVGEVIKVSAKQDAEQLVAGRFLEPVEDTESEDDSDSEGPDSSTPASTPADKPSRSKSKSSS